MRMSKNKIESFSYLSHINHSFKKSTQELLILILNCNVLWSNHANFLFQYKFDKYKSVLKILILICTFYFKRK